MKVEGGRASIIMPTALARWIDEVLQGLGDPKLKDRNTLARLAGSRIIKRYSLKKRKAPPRGHGGRVTVNVPGAQRSIIADAVHSEEIPFMTPDEAYRSGIIQILKVLEKRAARRQRVS